MRSCRAARDKNPKTHVQDALTEMEKNTMHKTQISAKVDRASRLGDKGQIFEHAHTAFYMTNSCIYGIDMAWHQQVS